MYALTKLSKVLYNALCKYYLDKVSGVKFLQRHVQVDDDVTAPWDVPTVLPTAASEETKVPTEETAKSKGNIL